MKKYIFLIGLVAAMYSCDSDIYDNIKEMVESEIIYPAGYDPNYVADVSPGGFERVEVDLWPGRPNAAQMSKLMPKAKKTVVEYPNQSGLVQRIVIDSVCSYVNITGLTLPQTYRFTIYTEDSWGNKSKPVESTGKPFTVEDKNAIAIITGFTAAATKIVLSCPSSSSYIFSSAKYRYTDKDGAEQQGESQMPSFTIRNLQAGTITEVNITYKLMVMDVIDMIEVTEVLKVKTALIDPPPFNVAVGKPVTESDHYGDLVGRFAVDGDRSSSNSRWCAGIYAVTPIQEHWLEIDLQTMYEIDSLRLYRNHNATENMKEFALQAWINDEWVNAFYTNNSPTASTPVPHVFVTSFPSVITDKVRYYVPSYNNNPLRIFEIEVYGSVY
jgi:hypothetical protein